MGLPGMSVNWGVIKDVGMVANKTELERYARAEGFEPVTMQDAMEVFNLIYDNEYTQIGIAKLDPESMASYYSALGQTSYFNGLLRKEKSIRKQEARFIDHFLSLQTHEERIRDLELLVIRHVASVVKTSATQINPMMTFQGLGIDSLMAIQLWNLLERSLGQKLPLAMFRSHPGIREYSSILCSQLEEQLIPKKTSYVSLGNKPVPANLSEWLVIPRPNPLARTRLLCFHDAGGNASLYHPWQDLIDDYFELIMVELPGRVGSTGERSYTSLSALIHDMIPVLIPMLDKPFYFFGHSMGGLLAFELALTLRKSNLNLPAKIFISSTPALTTYSQQDVDHTMTEQRLIEMFPHLDKATIGDDALQVMLVDLLRKDLQLIGSYQYVKEDPLPVPLVIIHGIDDSRVKKEQSDQWRRETSSSFRVISRPGGHRYIDDDAEFLTSLIQEDIGVAEKKELV
jgi:surfactin synthase thioesterase subunit/acyl carrier protein